MANLQRLLRIGLSLAFNPARIVEDAADAARRTAILVVCALVAALILIPAVLLLAPRSREITLLRLAPAPYTRRIMWIIDRA